MRRRSSVLLFSIIATSFYSFNAFADDTASSTFSIDVSNAALQVTAPATASIELNPTSSSAVFGSTNITVNVATNNMTGYTITMTVPTTDLTHSTITGDNAPIIPTLQSVAPQSTFPANAWGYKVTGDSYNPVLLTNSSPSWTIYNPTNSQDHIVTLGASVDGSKESGTYTNTLTFNVVANPVANRDTVSFNKNNENATGTMPDQVLFQDGSSTINKNLFQLSGMKFMGWSTTALGTGDGVYYYGDEAVYVSPNPGMNNNITLYAQWAPANTPTPSGSTPSGSTPTGTTFARAYEIAYTAQHKGMYEKDESDGGDGKYHLINSWPPYDETYHGYDVRFAMQDMTPEICASVTAMHDDYQALDIRDDKLYHITKTMDGNCWMTQNLDYDISAETTLRHADSDIGWTNFDANASWTPASSTLTDSSEWENKVYLPYSFNYGDVYVVTNPRHNYMPTDYNSLAGCIADNHSSAECTHYHIGNYYNWTAAIAENSSDTTFLKQRYNNAPNSICPAGWRLPAGLKGESQTAEDASDYNKLLYYSGIVTSFGGTNTSVRFTSDTARLQYKQAPLFFTEGGHIHRSGYNGSVSVPNFGDGVYHVSTIYNNSFAYLFNFNQASIGLQIDMYNYSDRSFGASVRCLAR